MSAIRSLLACLLCLGITLGHAQRVVVISTTGLHLRSAPSARAKVIATLPFGQEVELLDTQELVRDTIGTLKLSGSDGPYQKQLTGKWVKVAHQGRRGYVFDAYLAIGASGQGEHCCFAKLDEAYSLLMPGHNCTVNLSYDPSMLWYGLYSDGATNTLRRVTPSYYHDESSELATVGLTANDDEHLNFIIGSRLALPTGELAGIAQQLILPDELDQTLTDRDTLRHRIDNGSLMLHRDGRSQLLNPTLEPGVYKHAYTMLWQGDINGDGLADYIILFGEKTAEAVLYMSDEQNERYLVTPVSSYAMGYCC